MKNLSNILVILGVIAVLVFVSGQQGCQNEAKTNFSSTALAFSFVDNAPPTDLVTNQKYPIYVDLVNNGGYDIAPGTAHFYLTGIGENLRNVNTKVQNVNTLVKKSQMQDGGKERLTFATEAEPWQSLPAPFNLVMRLDTCYKYATITQTTLCIGQGSGICNISSEKITTSSNSAAPLQITSVTEQITGNKLYINFLIENKGTGQVFLSNADCDQLQEQNINEKSKANQVEINVRTEDGITCNLQSMQQPYPSVEGTTGMTSLGRVTCQKTLTGTETHITPVEIVMVYIYKDGITKSMTILPP